LDSFVLIIGLVAASLTTFSFLPQFIKIIKTKHSKDLSLITLIMIESGQIAWLCYGLLISNIPIISANLIAVIIIAIVLVMKIRYR
jgi:MtN3 and saliva related transmembrane protein